MIRRVALLVLIALSLLTCKGKEETTARDYNVLLVTIDTLRADHIGAWGARDAATPSLDRLASEGLRFENADSAVPLTLPSHATILSGVLPQHHGVRNNGAAHFPDKIPTLASTLAAAGYRTAAFVGSFVLDHRFGLNRGFATYDDEIVRDPNVNLSMEAERPATEVADRAITWLQRSDRRPFFEWVHFYDPHAPYLPPEPYRSKHASSPYDGEIEFADAQLGRLLDALKAAGLDQKTIVIVAGDHGEALGEHGEATHGLLLYEPTLHVPLLIRVPGTLKSRVVKAPVSLADVAPTIAALIGHPLSGTDGRDLSAALLDQKEPDAHDLYAETEYPTNFGWSGLASLRRDSLKFISAPTPELYDLAKDRSEAQNIRADRRREANALAQALLQLRQNSVATNTAVDAETRQKLASLGYVSAGGSTAPTNADPKVMAPLFHRFELAIFAINEGRRQEALIELKKLAAEDPRNPVFLSTLARTLRSEGELEAAAECYRQVVALTPADNDAWYNLGVTLQESGKSSEAAQVIAEALRRDPKRAEAHNTFGIILFDQGDVQRAMHEFEEAMSLDPRDPRAYNNAGNVLRAVGDDRRAEAAYRRAVALSPDYVDALNGLGAILVQRNDTTTALPLFDRALKINPSFHEARLNRGIALQLSGKRASAAAEYQAILKQTKGDERFARQREAAATLLSQLPDRVDH